MRKHVRVLELAELVTTKKVGRMRNAGSTRAGWRRRRPGIERHRQLWDARFDMLGKVVEELARKKRIDRRK
jgi:hypothetical protein